MTDSEMLSYFGERLTRAEISQLKKTDAADRKFFERFFPHRQHRFRLAGRVEIKRASVAGAIANLPPLGSKYYAMAKSNVAGMLIVYAIGPQTLDTDVSESIAREYFEAVNRRELSQMAELKLISAWE